MDAGGSGGNQWRKVLDNFGKFMKTTIRKSENIRRYEWDRDNNTIGKRIN